MPRPLVGPWYRASRGAWFATVGNSQVNLKVRGKENRAAAARAWHRLLADSGSTPDTPVSALPPPLPSRTVAELVTAFLADAPGRMSGGCLRNYRIYLGHLSASHGPRKASGLTSVEVEQTATRPDWASTYRANYLACVVTAFRWATRHRLIASNPLTDIRKPVKRSRGVSAVVTEAEHRKLLAVADQLMRDLLTVLWETGARPGEVTGLTAEVVGRASGGAIPLTEHKTADKGKARFLVVNERAMRVLRRRAQTGGPLFTGSRGGRLTPKAIAARMSRLCEKAGVRAIAYGYRHGFATAALEEGLPDAQVAALLGHSSTAMLHKHYAHLVGQSRVLKDAADRVRGAKSESEN